MNIGLIDVDNWKNTDSCFPNLVLMKLSAFYKKKGDNVFFYEPLLSPHCDIVYMSKVFSFSEDYPFPIDADIIKKGGSGYCITIKNGKERFDKSKDIELPYEIEHIFPDYSLYNIKNTAYGFLTRGCPRGCNFCHVGKKEGLRSFKVSDLNEFWNGQKEIVLLDPNILACKDYENLLVQLKNSGANIDFTQGLDIRLMTEKKAELLKELKIKNIHFAWDRYEDGPVIKPRLEEFVKTTGWDRHKLSCYVLTNFNTTLEQDLERIYFLKKLNINPYVMIYNKESLPRGHVLRKLQRFCNMRSIFWKLNSFEEYTS